MRKTGGSARLHIYTKILKNSVRISIGKSTYSIQYNERVWNKFPPSLHKLFADNLTYAVTWQLAIVGRKNVVYHFDHPVIEPLFFKILMYSLPMNVYTANGNIIALIKSFYNAGFMTEFKSLNHFYFRQLKRSNLKDSGLILFSFGKDSLLTLGLADEVGIKPVVMFMEEPQSKYENFQKRILVKRFKRKFSHSIAFFPVSFGHIRQNRGNYLGWDIILSQYVLTLIPYVFSYKTKYIFLGNEQSCNSFTLHNSGFLINPVYEQSTKAMQLLQDIPKFFQVKTHVGSLIEPIHELLITYILHHRYRDLARYQTSCFLENSSARKHRWCGNCEKCARMYVFFRALNIDPAGVGFPKRINMFTARKEHLYSLFTNSKETSSYGGSGLGRDEQLLAFLLAYLNGARGPLIDVYLDRFHDEALRRKDELIATYLGIHSALTIPPRVGKRVLKIFREEQIQLLKFLEKKMSTIGYEKNGTRSHGRQPLRPRHPPVTSSLPLSE